MDEFRKPAAAPGLWALIAGLRICGLTLARRWPALLGAAAAFLGLTIWMKRLWPLIPQSHPAVDGIIWVLASALPYVLHALFGALCSLQVMAAVDGRMGDLADSLVQVRRRLALAVTLAVIAGVLVIPLSALLLSFAQQRPAIDIARLSLGLHLLANLVGLAVGIFTSMAMPIAVDRDLTASGALRAGAALGARRWGCLLIASLVLMLVTLVTRTVGTTALLTVSVEGVAGGALSFLVRALTQAPGWVVSLLAVLYWPSLYVALRPAAERDVRGPWDDPPRARID